MGGPNTPVDDLQFDRVEGQRGPAAGACAACGQPIREVYYEVNGRVLCERCRQEVEASWISGSAAGRFGKAVAFGIAAAAAGSALYYGVLALTGYEFGLIAIVVGFLVGFAVRKASAGRGGWRYQALAVFLTYTSIVSSYVPLIVREVRNARPSAVSTADSAGLAPAVAESGALALDSAGHSDVAAASGPANPILVIALGIGLIYALPFLAGLQNIFGLVIIAIGLYQAWKMNQRAELRISGPFKVAA